MMPEPVQIPAAEIRQCLDEQSLHDWVSQQRWYASKSRAVTGIEVVEGISLHEAPTLFIALVQTRFATGTHELYQLPLAIRPTSEIASEDSIAHIDGWAVYDALAEPAPAVELDLSRFQGRYPVELFGNSRFPRIGELPYLLTLAPRGFYWFQLVEEGRSDHDA